MKQDNSIVWFFLGVLVMFVWGLLDWAHLLG